MKDDIFYKCPSNPKIDYDVLEFFAERRAGITTTKSGYWKRVGNKVEALGEQPQECVEKHLEECDSCRDYFEKNLDLGECIVAKKYSID